MCALGVCGDGWVCVCVCVCVCGSEELGEGERERELVNLLIYSR